MKTLRIATRKSPLALTQAEWVKNSLLSIHENLKIELVGLTTEGDIHLDTPLATKGGKGLFVKELEKALLDKSADIAVHSIKDIPVEFPQGLMLSVICKREDARDVFISKKYTDLFTLPTHAKVGTSSLRRQCQLKALRSDLEIINLRGNVQTRLQKLHDGLYDAIVLAAAGMHRLNLHDQITNYISPEIMLPAVGQGALGIECREDDKMIHELIAPLQDKMTTHCVLAERGFNKELNGGCQVPIAAYAQIVDKKIWLRGLVGNPDGSAQIRAAQIAEIENAESLGKNLAKEILKLGAKMILDDVYK